MAAEHLHIVTIITKRHFAKLPDLNGIMSDSILICYIHIVDVL